MLKKIEYHNKVWDTFENDNIITLIEEFSVNPFVESKTFEKLTDSIWDAGTCKPLFFMVIPYLIEIVSKHDFEITKDLWCYLGGWISMHERYRKGISEDILECFDLALIYAEEKCINQIVASSIINSEDAQYLYASLFAFAKHRLGYMAMGGYKDDIVGTSIAMCPNGHLNDVSIYDSGIVPYEEAEHPCDIADVSLEDVKIESREKNPWICFEKSIQIVMENKSISKEIKSHLELSRHIIKYGVTPKLPMKYAFSLYGSLLYCNGSVDESIRILHGWDKITCLECGEKFIFADGWCEDI